MPLWGAAIAAAAGVAKSEFVDKPKADRQRTLQAAKEKWSPWTGQHAEPVQEADPFGSALGFGVQGAQIGALSKYGPKGGIVTTEGTTTAGGTGEDASGLNNLDAPHVQTPSTDANAGQKLTAANDPAWFYGKNPSPNAQPTGMMAGYQPDGTAGGATMAKNGMNPNANFQDPRMNPWWIQG